ncbi:MAG: hypothetical protein QM751_11475 [Paludibacteraceae bacterium]
MNIKSVIRTWRQANTQSEQPDAMQKLPKLSFCILMDLLGVATYALPFWGEWGDIIWAPLSAFIFYRTFGGMTGAIGSMVNFVEELVPFADIIPTFTIGYFYIKYKTGKQ